MIFPLSNLAVTNQKASQKFFQKFGDEYNWHNTDQAGNLGYGWLHYALIRSTKPKHILCIGSLKGFIPAICAHACKDNQFGQVDFVDPGLDENKNDPHNWGGRGLWKKIDPYKYFKPFGLAKHIKLHQQTSQEFAKHYSKKTWDYVYVDGDHSYQGVKSDFSLFWPKLNSAGYLILHDIYSDHDNLPYGVHKLWQEIKKSKKYQTIELPGVCGLGIVQKPNSNRNTPKPQK